MLGKLIKHEFKATSRIYLPMFGAVLLLTLGYWCCRARYRLWIHWPA